jgi:hypothetical protein
MDLHHSPSKLNGEPNAIPSTEIVPRRRSNRPLLRRSSSTEVNQPEVLSVFPPDVQIAKESNPERQKPGRVQSAKTAELQNDNDLKRFDIDLSNIYDNANLEDSFIFEQKPVRGNKNVLQMRQMPADMTNFLAPQNFDFISRPINDAPKFVAKQNPNFKKTIIGSNPVVQPTTPAEIEVEPNFTVLKGAEPILRSLPQSKSSSPQRIELQTQKGQNLQSGSNQVSANNSFAEFPMSILNALSTSKDTQAKETIQTEALQNSPPKESRQKRSRRFSDRFKTILDEEPIPATIVPNPSNPFLKAINPMSLNSNENASRPIVTINTSKENSPLKRNNPFKFDEAKPQSTGFGSKANIGHIQPESQPSHGFISMSPLNKTTAEASMFNDSFTLSNENLTDRKKFATQPDELSTSKNLIILDYNPEDDKPPVSIVEENPSKVKADTLDRMAALPPNQTNQQDLQDDQFDNMLQNILGTEIAKHRTQNQSVRPPLTIAKKINTGFMNMLIEEKPKPKSAIVEEPIIPRNDQATFNDTQNFQKTVQPTKELTKQLSFSIQEENSIPPKQPKGQLDIEQASPSENVEIIKSAQKSNKVINLGPNQLIISSGQKRSTLTTQEYFKKVYQDELDNVLSQHLRINDDQNLEGKDPKQPTLAQTIHKVLQILQDLQSETEKFRLEDQTKCLQEFCRSMTFNERTRESMLKQFIFKKIILALTCSNKISFYKNLSHKTDKAFEKLYSVFSYRPKAKLVTHAAIKTTAGRTSTFLYNAIGLKVIKIVMSEDGKNVVYNFQFQENLSIVLKTAPNSKKIIFLQVCLIKIPLLLRERVKDKNFITDLIIRNFQERVNEGFMLELFDSLNFVCTCYHNFVSLYERLEQMLINKLIQEYSVDKEGRFAVRVKLPKLPFFDIQFLIWMSPHFSSNISYQLKNLDPNFQKTFSEDIKDFIKSLNAAIKTHYIDSYTPIAPRVQQLFGLMHSMSLFDNKEDNDSTDESKRNDGLVDGRESVNRLETIEIYD